MKKTQSLGIALSLAALLGSPLAAQASKAAPAPESPFSADLKLHFGWTPVERDHLHHDYQVVGVDFGYQTRLGRAGLELGWAYKTGDGFVQPLGADPSNLPAISTNWSGDARRNDLNGLMARLSLSRPWTRDLAWHAGLQIGGTLWNQQYFGDISGGRTSSTKWAWRDLYNGNQKGHFVGISPYAGIRVEIGHHGALEFNALLLNYQAKEYVHHPGTAGSGYKPGTTSTGKATSPMSDQNDFPLDSFTTRTRYVPHIEIAYVYHF